MLARSVLWGVKEVEHCLDTLHDEPILCGQEITTRESDRARTTLRELVELLHGVDLARPSNPADRRDEALGVLLSGMYTEGTASVESLAPTLSDGRETIATLEGVGHVETRQGDVYVPLQGTDAARNWPPVLQWLIQRLGEFVAETRAIAEKLRADGADGYSPERLLVRSLLERLERLRAVLRSQLGQLQVINYSVFVDSQIDHFLADVVPEAFGIDTTVEEIP